MLITFDPMRKYYIQTGKKLDGPFSIDELKNMSIDFHSKLCEQGTNEWKSIHEIPDFDSIKMDLKPDLLKRGINWNKFVYPTVGLVAIAIIFFGGTKAYRFYQEKASQVVASAPVDSVQKDSVEVVKKTLKPILFDNDITAYSSLISGIIPDSKREQLEDNETWINIQNLINEEWEKVVSEKVLPIQEWRDESPLANLDSATLFYPFAGADFLYSNNFFPKSNKIIMIGLEPVGSINTEKELDSGFYEYVKKIKSSLYTSNRSGYFMTLNMGKELHQSDLNGVLPLILFYARRQDFLVSNIEYLQLDDQGLPVVCSYKEAEGVRVCITDSQQKNKKVIEYYRTDLSNDGLTEESKFYKYFNGFENKNVFLKAASYLLHNSSFSNIRNIILSRTNIILQDDSGLPFSFVNNDNWTTELYGKYTRPIGLFSGRVQKSLREEFKKRKSQPLPFRIGYNISHNEPHLILAKRK
jgi:hypothetical protein